HQIRFLTQGCLSNGDFSADCTTPNGEARVTASLSPSRTSVRSPGTAFAGADSTWFASASQETVVKVRARGTLNLFFSANGAAPTIFNQLRNGDEMQMV